MKNRIIQAVLIAMVFTAPAFSQHYIGVKGGILDLTRGLPFDDGSALGLLYGYDIPDNNIAIEAEFNTSVSDPESNTASFGDLGVTTLAAYAVYRNSGTFYFKGKAGLLYEYLNSTVSGPITVGVEGSAIGISLGIGGGIRFNEKLSAEIEYTLIESDIGYASLGVNWAL